MTADPDGQDPGIGTGSSRCYQITHRTVYRYSDVVTSSYGRGFLTPRDSARQRCLSHQLLIDPEAADSSTSRDAYGNKSSYFHVTQRHQTLSITSHSVVEVDPIPAELYDGGSARAPWEISRPVGLEGALATEFTLDLQPPEITDEVRDYAAASFAPERPLIEVLRDLSTRIYSDFTYRSGSTTVSTQVNEVLAAREGRMPGLRAARDRLPARQRPGRQLRIGLSGDRPATGEGTDGRYRRDPRLARGVDAAEPVAGF